MSFLFNFSILRIRFAFSAKLRSGNMEIHSLALFPALQRGSKPSAFRKLNARKIILSLSRNNMFRIIISETEFINREVFWWYSISSPRFTVRCLQFFGSLNILQTNHRNDFSCQRLMIMQRLSHRRTVERRRASHDPVNVIIIHIDKESFDVFTRRGRNPRDSSVVSARRVL